jgi:hypothetical protein
MAEMLSEVYDALKEAGVSEEKARAAASAVVGLRDEPWKRKIEADMADLKSTQRLHSWMLGTTITLNVAILLRLLFL